MVEPPFARVIEDDPLPHYTSLFLGGYHAPILEASTIQHNDRSKALERLHLMPQQVLLCKGSRLAVDQTQKHLRFPEKPWSRC